MTDRDEKEFAKLCALMSQAFDKPMSEMLIGIYFEGLQDFDIEQVASAVKQAVQSNKFMPKVAELRELIAGSANDKAELAWRTFVDLVRDEADYPSLHVTDGGMAYAIECMGGWRGAVAKLNAASPEMAASLEKNFKNSYRLGQFRNEGPKYFVGAYEVNNRNGLDASRWPTLNQSVCVVRLGHVQALVMPLDVAEGRLTDEARQALADGGESLKKYLPAPTKPVKVLNPAPGAEMATPEEVAELKARALQIAPSQRNGLTLIKQPRGK